MCNIFLKRKTFFFSLFFVEKYGCYLLSVYLENIIFSFISVTFVFQLRRMVCYIKSNIHITGKVFNFSYFCDNVIYINERISGKICVGGWNVTRSYTGKHLGCKYVRAFMNQEIIIQKLPVVCQKFSFQ